MKNPNEVAFQRIAIAVKDSEGLILKVGDNVTRTGIDLHKVIDIDEDYGLIDVRCISDSSGCYEVGEVESNLPKRYSIVNNPINNTEVS